MAARAIRRWLPGQHGAWAMLLVPFLAGMLLADPTPWHAALLFAWLVAYLAAHHVQQWLRLRRNSRNPKAAARHTVPAAVFTAALLPPGLALVVHAPWLLLVGLAALPFFAINSWYAWRNQERSLVNGLAAVVPACGMLPVAALLGGGTWAEAWRPALACLLYFAGTVPYVKTMIRERGSEAYRWASGLYHGAAVVVAGLLSPWLAVFFGVCLVRAVVMPGLGRVRIAVVGAVEVVLSLALLAVLLPVYG
ncbi:YwiC-like family protein [Streptomyces justiciae]|uniref:YwiC-like family protein n=1 Tax=Streptomyces justiciae TaxID=2780140 RepID=UPI0018800A33|nr:YwiC-like family protein [Streptomyces justiciae]MBE8476186.1 YwiC-like family protein [Streptomyces justiciae]MCW8377521.1 YwiC-like family protein [Streptomyces justiciae]